MLKTKRVYMLYAKKKALNMGKPTINEVLSYLRSCNFIFQDGYSGRYVGRRSRKFLYISISALSIGGGYIIDGHPQKGASRKGGEIGHFSLIIYGKPCFCGNSGCFERCSQTKNELLINLVDVAM